MKRSTALFMLVRALRAAEGIAGTLWCDSHDDGDFKNQQAIKAVANVVADHWSKQCDAERIERASNESAPAAAEVLQEVGA